MLQDLTAREQEIARLREEKQWTFQSIGSRLGVSANRAWQIYRHIQRKRRAAKRRLMSLPENQIRLSFSLTRGEVIVLKKFLSAILAGQLDPYLQIKCHELDPDYLSASELQRRLMELL